MMKEFYLCCNLYNFYEFIAYNLEMQVLYYIYTLYVSVFLYKGYQLLSY